MQDQKTRQDELGVPEAGCDTTEPSLGKHRVSLTQTANNRRLSVHENTSISLLNSPEVYVCDSAFTLTRQHETHPGPERLSLLQSLGNNRGCNTSNNRRLTHHLLFKLGLRLCCAKLLPLHPAANSVLADSSRC